MWRDERAADAKRGDGWTLNDHLTALVAEQVNAVFRVLYAANSKKGAKQPDPLQVRPRSKRRVSPGEFFQMMRGG